MAGGPVGIADPVHGTIPLSPEEVQIVGCRSYQRLRNIKQLGLVSYVFPGADYSRFSHSLGACHVAGMVIAAINKHSSQAISPQENRLYRLAALLHDVGHYPFSHSMEHVLKDYFAARATVDRTTDAVTEPLPKPYLDHESVGEEVLRHDAELRSKVKEADVDPDEVADAFRGIKGRLTNLVHSDLDVDRIDFLLRTAHFTGLPYGNVDIDYVVGETRLDDKGRISLSDKAMRSVDHLLLCRFFDYQQVPFQKTAAGLEEVLKDVLTHLLSSGTVSCDTESIRGMIVDGSWGFFDDSQLLQNIRSLTSGDDELLQDKARALVHRRPPKLLIERDTLARPGSTEASEIAGTAKRWRGSIPVLAERYGLDEGRFYVWEGKVDLSTFDPLADMTDRAPEEIEEAELEIEEIVRILDRQTGESTPITRIRSSLMSLLGTQAWRAARFYVLLPVEGSEELDAMRREVHAQESSGGFAADIP